MQTFEALGLSDAVVRAVASSGYTEPTPIQTECIPVLAAGKDVLGQAQTGTGKTAAFALPLLDRIDPSIPETQVLVLAPTRELAIQVADSFKRYASERKGLRVLPVYGGSAYGDQIRALNRGAHVVVGTPGRVMDHMERGRLKLESLRAVVLDEADEMLNMGFQEDVEWILERTPETRQVALFSATMPSAIRKIARRYLKDAVEVKTSGGGRTADCIEQTHIVVRREHKFAAMTRILEVEDFEAILVFVRTRADALELSSQLVNHGLTATALTGEIPQKSREKIVEQLRSGGLKCIVATDVAARGLDVERIGLVVNYDMPFDRESYVHRIGRTGRAGKAGKAILFVTPRERSRLGAIERTAGAKIPRYTLPSVQDVNARRVERFCERITERLGSREVEAYKEVLAEFHLKTEIDPLEIAAALAAMAQGSTPLLMSDSNIDVADRPRRSHDRPERGERPERGGRRSSGAAGEFEVYRFELGRNDGLTAGKLVGTITNRTRLESSSIGRINIRPDGGTIELSQVDESCLDEFKKLRVSGTPLSLHKAKGFRDRDSDSRFGGRTSGERGGPSFKSPGPRKFGQGPKSERGERKFGGGGGKFGEDRGYAPRGAKPRKFGKKKPGGRKPFMKPRA